MKKVLFFILAISLFLRLYRIDYPKGYVFDEVYHGFTAVEYSKGSIQAWEWWTTPPTGVAFEWTHPPLAKEIMASSLLLFRTEEYWGWRVPGALLGTVSIYLVYLLGKKIFSNERVGLLASFIFAFDGLNFVQSRTGMNDIYLVTFILASLYFFIDKKFFISSLFLGLAIACKWTAIYFLGFYFLLLLFNLKNLWRFSYFLLIPSSIYMFTYIPFFIMGHTLDQFIELQRQMFYYHTHLKADHDYSSPWWSWPFNLKPVWFYVEYYKDSVANIFTSGNPPVFWLGFLSFILSFIEVIKRRSYNLFLIVFGYLIFILPWAFSPRIMFLYHYSPALPFLSLMFGYQLNKLHKNHADIIFFTIGLILFGFILIYPFLTGVPLRKELMDIFFSTNLTKNPFR